MYAINDGITLEMLLGKGGREGEGGGGGEGRTGPEVPSLDGQSPCSVV